VRHCSWPKIATKENKEKKKPMQKVPCQNEKSLVNQLQL